MTNSGVPQFPQPGQYRPDSANARSAGDNTQAVGNLGRAPDEIRREITAQRQEIRLQGEVTQVQRDGNIRVDTPRGEIEVRVPPDQPRPQTGQAVEIEITPSARDARADALPQVTIRPSAQNADISTRPTATPVQIEVRGEQPPARAEITPPSPNATPAANRFPEAGSLVRLEPVSSEQLQQLVATRQIATPESVRSVLNAPASSDALALANAPGGITTSSNPTLSIQTLDIPQPPLNTLAGNAANTLSTPNTTLITPDGSGADGINIPVLNRAQAAIAQLQNAAGTSSSAADPASSLPAAQDVRIGSIQPPQAFLNAPNQTALPLPYIDYTAQNAVLNTQNASQVSGIVIAKTQNQVPIVQFSTPQNTAQPLTQSILNAPITAPLSPVEQQTFILQFPSDALLLGSRVDVTPQALLNVPAQAAQTSAVTSALPVLPFANLAFPQAWPALQDIQQTLLQSSAQNAAQTAQAFSNVIPSPANASQFGPAALLFIAAVRGGDLGSWMSDKASEILRQSGKTSTLSRISSEANGLSRAAEAPSGEWRGMNIPLMWDGDIQKIALHYRHDSASDSDDNLASSNKGTRFIFDLNLDVMGKVQLDGFFRPVSADGPRLDVVLRTEERFSGAMQAEMRRIYMDAIKPSQVGGELSFQDGMSAWVMIDAESDSALGVSA